jgi:hypothetical protein
MRRSDGSVGSLYSLQLLHRTRVELYFGVLARYNKPVSARLKRRRQQRLKGFKKRKIGFYEKRRRLRSSGFRKRDEEQRLLQRSSGCRRLPKSSNKSRRLV